MRSKNNMKSVQPVLDSHMNNVYLDANLFIASVTEKDTLAGQNAREILTQISHGKYKGYAATLVIDELLWVIQKSAGRETAAQAADFFLSLPHLEFINVDSEIIALSIKIYKNEHHDP